MQEKNYTNLLQYNRQFDIDKYSKLIAKKNRQPENFRYEEEMLNNYIQFNLITSLSERFNAEISKRRDEIKNNRLYGQNCNEPLIEMFKRGRDYRKQNGSSEHDQMRENAEVEGFAKIEKVLTDPGTAVGTMMLSISPQGGKDSIYKHNFYDVFILKEEKGKRYVECRRYSSALSREEYMEKILSLQDGYFTNNFNTMPFDVYFLSNPIKIDPKNHNFNNPDSLHKYFHKEHNSMSEEVFEEIIKKVTPFILAYIKILSENPYDFNKGNLAYNAILNKADQVAFRLYKEKKDGFKPIYAKDSFTKVSWKEIEFFGSKPVRFVTTGCGYSGGFDIHNDKLPFFISHRPIFNLLDFSFFNRHQEKKWEYKIGDCRICKRISIKVGPCKICKECEKKFE